MPLSRQELDRFHDFVSKRLDNGFAALSLEDTLREFRAYQNEADRFKAELQESIDQARRGDVAPLDVEEFMADLRQRLAKEGITD